MARLLPQLSRSAAPLSQADVQRFLSQSGVHLFVFRSEAADAD
ncbi:MAG: GNAT family N-acetyltransferase, partial [Schaalia odontolytica]